MSTTTPPKKEVIYVDIEDDITSIIDKVKHASTSIVALVPPKRIGALQSVVNLKLLQRAAESSKKRLVMITSDPALSGLAAAVALPVAKNLQSKPEIPEISALNVDDEDVIDGEVADKPGDDSGVETAAAASVLSSTPKPMTSSIRKRPGATIPNFDAFRNKLIFIGGGVVVLVAFLVWAIVYAPSAAVTVVAKTTPYSVNKPIVATSGGQLDATDGYLPAVTKEIKKTVSVDFQATGKKEVGEKATGQVKFTKQGLSPTAVPVGTELETSEGLVFVTNAAATIPASTVGPSCFPTACPGTVTVAVTASDRGTKSNAATGVLSGGPDGATAAFVGPTSGGTDKTITVVSEQDAATARDKLATQDGSAAKTDLKKQFSAEVFAVEESFAAAPGSPAVAPAVDQEATTAKVSVETKYTMIGVSKSDVRSIIETNLKKQIGGLPNQSIYDQGIDKVRFTNYSQQDMAYKMNVVTTGYVGPLIDSNELAKKLVGKREGEIQQIIKTYEGIKSVDVRFAPFWVSTAPSSDKITITFQIDNAKN